MSKHNFGRLLHDLSHGEHAVDHHGLKPRRPPPGKPPLARVSRRPIRGHIRPRPWLVMIGMSVAVAALILAVGHRAASPPVQIQTVAAPQVVVNDVADTTEPVTVNEPLEMPKPTTDVDRPIPIANKPTLVATPAVASRRLYRLRSPFDLLHELEQNSSDIGADRDGLPMLGDRDCHVTHSTLARIVSTKLTAAQRSRRSASESVDVSAAMRELLHSSHQWRQQECVTTLNQILQIEDDPVRLMLVESLALVPGPEASRALADRAIYDLSHYVRDAATDALKKRPLLEYRQQLLNGFRYPWAEIACNAAEACVELGHVEFIDALTAILDEPDPCAPSCSPDGVWTRNELVRMNHLSNCTLCHAKTQASPRDPSRFVASIPVPGRPLPVLYYHDHPTGEVIQVDVVYLRQDFSTIHFTNDFSPWPERQRYDYLVRKRRLTDAEIAEAESTKHRESNSYPQRAAVQLAIERLQASHFP